MLVGATLLSLVLLYLQIADLLVEHPSCSKQHAVIQFRLVEVPRPPGQVEFEGPAKTVKYVS